MHYQSVDHLNESHAVVFTPMPEDEQLQAELSKLYRIPWNRIIASGEGSNTGELPKIRFLYCYFAYFYLNKTQEQVGKEIKRHHSTVLNAIRRIMEHNKSKDPAFNTLKTNFSKLNLFIAKIQQHDNSIQHHNQSVTI